MKYISIHFYTSGIHTTTHNRMVTSIFRVFSILVFSTTKVPYFFRQKKLKVTGYRPQCYHSKSFDPYIYVVNSVEVFFYLLSIGHCGSVVSFLPHLNPSSTADAGFFTRVLNYFTYMVVLLYLMFLVGHFPLKTFLQSHRTSHSSGEYLVPQIMHDGLCGFPLFNKPK